MIKTGYASGMGKQWCENIDRFERLATPRSLPRLFSLITQTTDSGRRVNYIDAFKRIVNKLPINDSLRCGGPLLDSVLDKIKTASDVNLIGPLAAHILTLFDLSREQTQEMIDFLESKPDNYWIRAVAIPLLQADIDRNFF